MTFAPKASPRAGAQALVRTALFWLLMILLATVLWRMGAANKGDKGTLAMDYSEFMQQVDLKNIASATLYTTPSATEIQGRLRQPSREFKVTVPKEVIPALTERLRNQGAPIEVKARDNAGWLEFVINIAPFALVFGVWVFLVKRRGTKPDQSPPGNLSNRPIG